ncbi:MAG: hypothetical protein J0L72_08190 [Armatimonadetes bacterium]|nr:hypothetical protein [Armatimonadota bacterium]
MNNLRTSIVVLCIVLCGGCNNAATNSLSFKKKATIVGGYSGGETTERVTKDLGAPNSKLKDGVKQVWGYTNPANRFDDIAIGFRDGKLASFTINDSGKVTIRNFRKK